MPGEQQPRDQGACLTEELAPDQQHQDGIGGMQEPVREVKPEGVQTPDVPVERLRQKAERTVVLEEAELKIGPGMRQSMQRLGARQDKEVVAVEAVESAGA
jgi:hypothetical protein